MGSYFHSFRESFGFLVQHEGFSRSPFLCCTRVLAWYAQVILGIAPRVRIPSWPAVFTLPKAPRGPAKVFYVFREDYEPEVRFFLEHIRPGDVFVDVGANFGLFTVLGSRRVADSGKVVAFEPWDESAEHAERNVRLNRCENVSLHRCALSDREGTSSFSVHADCGRNSLGQLDSSVTAKVLVQKLDNLLTAHGIHHIDWMKVDVEGAEELVLRGGLETIERDKPAIVFETTSEGPKRLGLPAFGAWNFLQSLGYEFFCLDDPKLPQLQQPRLGDTLAIHPDSGRKVSPTGAP